MRKSKLNKKKLGQLQRKNKRDSHCNNHGVGSYDHGK